MDLVLCECFARDGLQHEPAFVPTATKRALVERFAALGFPRVEAQAEAQARDAFRGQHARDQHLLPRGEPHGLHVGEG